jgi:hypothetical protein
MHRQAPDDNSFFVRPPSNGGFSVTSIVPRLAVMPAYDIQESQIVGGPAWFATDRFVIEVNSDDIRSADFMSNLDAAFDP